MEVENGQAEIQIFPEIAVRYLFFQVAVGGRHDTHVYFRGFRIPHLYIFPCFEHAQEFGLQAVRHLPDLVQKYRAVVSLFKQSFLVLQSPGESPGFMPEYLAFQQFFAESGTVDGHERLLGTRASVMNGLCEYLFSRPRLARKQHRHVCHGHFASQLYHLLQTSRMSQDSVEGRFTNRHDSTSRRLHRPAVDFLHSTADYRYDLIVVIPLGNVVECAVFDSLHPVRDISVSRQEDDLCFGLQFFYLLYHLHPVAIGQKHIAQYQLRRFGREQFQARGTIGRLEHLITFQFHHACQQFPYDGFVIYNQYRIHHLART